MYGDGGWVAADDPAPSFEQWPYPTAGGRDGSLTSKHRFISAVTALRTGRNAGAQFDAPPEPEALDQPYLHVIDTMSDEAYRLPPAVFNGSSDARWAPDEHNHYRQVAAAARLGSVRDPDT